MFYSQSVENIKLVVLTLDGGLLDLNRLRFNYYRRTCRLYHQDVSREKFSYSLGNMKTMYKDSPIQDVMKNQDFNDMIEKDLFEYIKLKPDIKKEGVDEFIQYCKQKNIKIAVYTTHKSKRAIQYLQLTDLYRHVDFLIGGDSKIAPLPGNQILSVICRQMNVKPKNTLVVANFESMVEAALNLYTNVIYLEDLIEANDTIKACVYKVCHNFLDVMNVFLFWKYDTMEIFSPLLGMNSDMDRDTLYLTRRQLIDKYRSDPQLIELVNSTYDYFVDQINKKEMSDEFSKKQKIVFTFDDDEEIQQTNDYRQFNKDINLKKARSQEKTIDEIKEEIQENIEETFEKPLEDFIEDVEEDCVEKPVEETVEDFFEEDHEEIVEENRSEEEPFSSTRTFTYDFKRMNELMDIVNGDSEKEDSKEIEEEEKDEETIKKGSISDKILNILFNVLISMIIVLVGIIIKMFIDDFSDTSMISMIVNGIGNGYLAVVNTIYGFIFNTLHMILGIIPDYDNFIHHNSLLSPLASLSMLCVIFNFVLITLLRLLFRSDDEAH